MKRKLHKNSAHHESIVFNSEATNSDFYAGGQSERPLYQDRLGSHTNRVRKTVRHQAAEGHRKEATDPREMTALLGILKLTILVLLLVITLVIIWKGAEIYENRLALDNQPMPEDSAINIASIDDLGVSEQGAGDVYVGRLETWKETRRLMSTVDALLYHNNVEQAIARCQDALKLDPFHMEALERLGRLYATQGMHNEAIKTYIRLLDVDPSRKDLQKALIKTLDSIRDSNAVISLARWYLEQNNYDEDIQRFMSNAYFRLEQYNEAAVSYERVLKDAPDDTQAMGNLASAYMHMEQYDKALTVWNRLGAINYRDKNCYRQIAICNAQLGNGLETVQSLGKAAHLFGQNTVVLWIQDPMLDPVRFDRDFRAFADSVGGEEYRKWLEKVAKNIEDELQKQEVIPLLNTDESNREVLNLLESKD